MSQLSLALSLSKHFLKILFVGNSSCGVTPPEPCPDPSPFLCQRKRRTHNKRTSSLHQTSSLLFKSKGVYSKFMHMIRSIKPATRTEVTKPTGALPQQPTRILTEGLAWGCERDHLPFHGFKAGLMHAPAQLLPFSLPCNERGPLLEEILHELARKDFWVLLCRLSDCHPGQDYYKIVP